MPILSQAAEAITVAEQSLRRLIAEAASAGDYSSIETLIRWAEALKEIVSESEQSGEARSRDSVQAVNSGSAASSTQTAQGRKRKYPTFARHNGNLIKVAWSKSSKSEYQHKSPHKVALLLAEALARRGKNRSIVPMDKILPLKADDNSQIPDYQAYVSLAWLRHIGVIKQNGRQGYSVKNPAGLSKAVETAWSELQELKPS